MKSSRKVVIAILIGVSLLFGAASAVSAATHAGPWCSRPDRDRVLRPGQPGPAGR